MDINEQKKCIAKAQKGDVDSFEKLIEACKTKAYNLCFHYMKNEHDAQDALQESFIKIFRHLKDFKGESSFDTWVYRIASNTCNDMLRSGRGRMTEPMTKIIDGEEIMLEVPDSSANPEYMLERKEKIKLILHSVEKLTDIYREAIILRDIQGFRYDQIAKILNCSEGAVKSRINRARTSLREILRSELAREDEGFSSPDQSRR